MMSTAAQQKNVEKAAKVSNPLEFFNNLEYSADNTKYFFNCCKKSELNAKLLKWAFKLAEQNVSPFYKKLSIGWQPKIKQNDLNKNWARYLVAFEASKKQPVAYAMFRFDMDYGQSVLYCYEMQIEVSSQRKGLGKYMMNTLELCARHWQMEKIVLTVLKNNDNAMAFFKALGYTLDDSSPDVLEKAEYEILSKQTIF